MTESKASTIIIPEQQEAPTTPDPSPPKAPDPTDLESLRLPPDYNAKDVSKKVILTVPVGKPNRQTFFRAHPHESYRQKYFILELKEENEFYVIRPDIARALPPGECYVAVIYTIITRQDTIRLWPVRQTDPDGKINEWHRTADVVVQMSMNEWVRAVPDRGAGGYSAIRSNIKWPDPDWRDYSFDQLFKIAFREERIVTSGDHPLIKRLSGEMY